MVTQKSGSNASRKIIGISIAPELAREVKSEAGRRGISLRKLFEEMWDLYRRQAQSKSHP